MPSVVVGNPVASGAQVVVSGSLFSGGPYLRNGVQLRYIGSGTCFISLSGGGPPLSGGFMTVNSGGMVLSGGCQSGMLDGMPLLAGDRYYVPPGQLTNLGGVNSGVFNIWALTDSAGSGGRLYFEPFRGFDG